MSGSLKLLLLKLFSIPWLCNIHRAAFAKNLHQVNIQWSMIHCSVNLFNKQNGHVISETYCLCAIPTVLPNLLRQ